MPKLTMKDRWEIHNKLEEVNNIITEKLYVLESKEDKKEWLSYQIKIEEILFGLVY
ncbi:hypothetical protein ABE073_04535 [Lederbergia citrisecunda]|uniref:hypothetical protein n=1 Tax=Lederbergia citrisecunda TaxID=2833583 RepID=UPI003D2D6FCF